MCRITGFDKGAVETQFYDWLLGVLYDVSIPAMVVVSVAAQLAAIPLYLCSSKLHRDGLKGENA